jgi:eukaryotic-like serine/threonine-protein kinase
MKFTYRWGQRPLEGYTLKRGLGQGGFGEVYFAVSDGGKEVAVKLIRGHSDTELRGIANCLNLKHPNLVHLYDLRLDGQGDRWLVMEYIQGVPLSTILERHPRGLPEGQARRWFLQTARAVAFLHDHAVVHRDIKPANVFVENGLAKLGDYGLSKAVGTSQHAQSSNVGTIHYMAPEVASGNYSKQIDVYACGVLLYEMLTGQVPFKGDSWAEIAIKHQTDRPDMRRVPAVYVPILEKALSKKAEKRFANMDAMIDAFETAGRPEREAPRPPREPDRPTKPDRDAPAPPAPSPPATSWRVKANELSTACLVTPLFAIPITAIWALFTGGVQWHVLGSLLLTMVAVAWSVLWTTKIWEGRSKSTARRLALGLFGAVIGCGAFWLDGWSFPRIWLQDDPLPAGMESLWGGLFYGEVGALSVLSAYAVYFGLALMVPRWWLSAERRRADRFSLYPLFATGFVGLVLLLVWKGIVPERLENATPGYLVLALAGAATIVQLVSPYSPPPPRNTRNRRRLYEPARY